MLDGQRQCQAPRRDGQPCQAWAVSESGFCFIHDPARAGERAEARRKGGLHRRKGSDPSLAKEMAERSFRTLADMEGLLEVAVRATFSLENSVSRNRTLGYLAKCWAEVHQVGELEERLMALEQVVKKRLE